MAMDATRDETFAAATDETVETLGDFLSAEIAALETYRQALEKIDDPDIRSTLSDCLLEHEGRAEALRNRIVSMGGQAPDSPGAWGSFAKLVEGGARLFGVRAAINALEEGEDRLTEMYRRRASSVDEGMRDFVERELLPSQERSHALVSQIKHSIH
jgi:hypothetical protein